jgi:hypothetical protein
MRYNLWIKNEGRLKPLNPYRDGEWFISCLSPEYPVPYLILEGCMDWLRRKQIQFFVEWL